MGVGKQPVNGGAGEAGWLPVPWDPDPGGSGLVTRGLGNGQLEEGGQATVAHLQVRSAHSLSSTFQNAGLATCPTGDGTAPRGLSTAPVEALPLPGHTRPPATYTDMGLAIGVVMPSCLMGSTAVLHGPKTVAEGDPHLHLHGNHH